MLKIKTKLLVGIGLALMLLSCDKTKVFSKFESVDGAWDKTDTLSFTFHEPDTVNAYNMFINLRNDETYEFSNLYLIVEMNYPDGKVDSDTLQYEMAAPDGAWLGEGFSSVKESKLWYKGYKEPFVFPQDGEYKVDVLQAMRKNGSINGVIALEGITDVGISVEKTSK